MPSPDALRAMEDAWLDQTGFAPAAAYDPSSYSSSSSSGYHLNTGAGGGDDDDGTGAAAAMMMEEDAYGWSAVAGPLVRGALVGFVFPLGVVGWLGKEEGMLSRRMYMFVLLGTVLSLLVGLVRELMGEG